jgi:hypothetical protein
MTFPRLHGASWKISKPASSEPITVYRCDSNGADVLRGLAGTVI